MFLFIKLSNCSLWNENSKSIEEENDKDNVISFLEEQKNQGFSEKEVFEKIATDKSIAKKLVATKLTENESGGQKKFILIGTKYCGHGNKSESDDERGYLNKVDTCCFEHDSCNLTINSGKFRWGLHNTEDYTISDCKCDEKFYDCLKNVRGKLQGSVAYLVGMVFFNGIKIKCINIPEGFDINSDKESDTNTYEPTSDDSPQPSFQDAQPYE